MRDGTRMAHPGPPAAFIGEQSAVLHEALVTRGRISADVAIIGAGIAGCMIARELARYHLRTVVLEKALDVASQGVTKGSMSVIHADLGAPGSYRAQLTVRANPLFEGLCDELGVPFQRCGLVVAAFDGDDLQVLDEMRRNAELNGATPYRPLTREEVLALEPNLSPAVIAGLYQPAEGMLYSFDLALACYENAAANGVGFLLGTQVTGLAEAPGGGLLVRTNRGEVAADFAVNAAGLFVDDVARLLGDEGIAVTPVRGQHLVTDRRLGGLVSHMVWDSGLGAIMPTPHGNLLIGSTYEETGDKRTGDCHTAEGREELFRAAQRLVPAIDRRAIIRAFAGLRSINDRNDHLVQLSGRCSRLVSVSLVSGGLTASPLVARRVVEILAGQGLELAPNEGFDPRRLPIPDLSEMTDAEREAIIAQDPSYGRIICRCEMVSEGEIVAAIRRGARTVDGVKYRVRAGMGRCQGGFCGPRVATILARELGVGMESIRKGAEGAWLVRRRLQE
jgi:glycerol-3-phosphate dehydrogenase